MLCEMLRVCAGGVGETAVSVCPPCSPPSQKRKRATCKHEAGCEKNAKKGGFCISHGGTHIRSKCKHEDGCEKWALKGGFCIAHGGTQNRSKCKHEDGCEKAAKTGGFCMAHWRALPKCA